MIWETLTNRFAVYTPPVKCGILLQFAVWIKRKTADND